MRVGEPLAAPGGFVQSCSQPRLLRREKSGVPRRGDGVTAPWDWAVGLGSPPCSGGEKGSLHLWFVACKGCEPGGARGWRVFVKHSEIPVWKELMKSSPGAAGAGKDSAPRMLLQLLWLHLTSPLPHADAALAAPPSLCCRWRGFCSPHPRGKPLPPAPRYRRPCSTTLTSPALSLLPAWIASWHLMSAITPCSPRPDRLPTRSGRTPWGCGSWCWGSWPFPKNQLLRELSPCATRSGVRWCRVVCTASSPCVTE